MPTTVARKRSTTAKSTRKTSASRTGKTTARKTGAKTTARKTSVKTTARKTGTRTTAAARSTSTTARASARTTTRTARKSPNAAFMRPMQPDSVLAAVVGNKPLPRTQVTKKLWAYIKKNDLQDANRRTVIVADAKLKPIFGGRAKVDMFQMTKLVNRHLLED